MVLWNCRAGVIPHAFEMFSENVHPDVVGIEDEELLELTFLCGIQIFSVAEKQIFCAFEHLFVFTCSAGDLLISHLVYDSAVGPEQVKPVVDDLWPRAVFPDGVDVIECTGPLRHPRKSGIFMLDTIYLILSTTTKRPTWTKMTKSAVRI